MKSYCIKQLTLLILFTLCTSAAGEAILQFKEIPVRGNITGLAPSANGKYLLTIHKKENLISIWDSTSGKVVKTIIRESPSVILRIKNLFLVGSRKDNNISVYSAPPECSLTDELNSGVKGLGYLTAPRGDFFDNKIIACGRRTYSTVDIDEDEFSMLPLEGRDINLKSSYDGSTYVLQQISQSGVVNTSVNKAGDWKRKYGANSNSVSVKQFIYQCQNSSYWFGWSKVFKEPKLKVVSCIDASLIIPSSSNNFVYAFKNDRIDIYTFIESAVNINNLSYSLPEGYSIDQFCEPTLIKDRYGNRLKPPLEYSFSRMPVALTNNGKLKLFLTSPFIDKILFAETVAVSGQGKGNSSQPLSRCPAKVQIDRKVKFYVTGNSEPGSFKILKGPKSAKINKNGLITWSPENKDYGIQKFKVRCENSSGVSFKRFKIIVVDNGNPKQSPRMPYANRKMNGGNLDLVYGNNCDRVLLLNNLNLIVLDADGMYELEKHKLPKLYKRIKERPEYYLGLTRHSLDLLDKKSLHIIKSIPLPSGDTFDFCPHPLENKSYVAVFDDDGGKRSGLAAKRILLVDEKNGKYIIIANTYGEMISIDPGGRFLYVSIKDRYISEIVPNWNFSHLLPNMEYIDLLLCYVIKGNELIPYHSNHKPGDNGVKIVASPDGKNVTYLSKGGFRLLAGENHHDVVPAFKSGDVRRLNSTFILNDDAVDMCYHTKLPIVACATSNKISLCHLESGRPLFKDIANIKKKNSESFFKVLFSPSGKNLIVASQNCNDDQNFLQVIPLSLNKDQLKLLKNSPLKPPVPKPVKITKPDKPAVPQLAKAGLDLGIAVVKRLFKSKTKKLSPKNIFKENKQAVVVIKTSMGTGTGFFITDKGHILTCAHLFFKQNMFDFEGDLYKVDLSKITVEYSIDKKPRTLDATLIGWDVNRDLALLKVKSKQGRLQKVAFANSNKLKTGEDVWVIGHPGVGIRSLDYTMTEGIVSHPKRMLGELPYIQTSAPINPGCSGSPLFNSNGLVVGLVVLKANIEGAGFAVPSKNIAAFLVKLIKEKSNDKK